MKTLILGLILSTLSFQGFAATRVITLVNHQYEGVKQWLPGTIYANVGDDVELHLINKKGKRFMISKKKICRFGSGFTTSIGRRRRTIASSNTNIADNLA